MTCACEPRNVWLCCDKTACSWGGQLALNGNKVTEVETMQAAGPSLSLRVRISHVAGRMPELCLGGDPPSFFGVILSLICIVPFIAPALCLLSTCLPVETVVELSSQEGQVQGFVTRRSGCCTWCTPVHHVHAVMSEEVCDDEAPARVFLCHGTGGLAKEELSSGFVFALHGAIKGFLAAQKSNVDGLQPYGSASRPPHPLDREEDCLPDHATAAEDCSRVLPYAPAPPSSVSCS